jgi:enoyl-CoA hydratase
MPAASDHVVLTERRDAVLVVTINRPQARNALNQAVTAALLAAYRELDEDDGLRAGVLTGAGGYFSGGLDLKAFARGEPFDDTCFRSPPRKPWVAAIEGFALAGGLELAFTCDLIVAARGSQLGFPEVRRGLAASGGGLLRLATRAPYHLVLELALTGAPITSERGAELGLVNRLVEPGGALLMAVELAQVISENAPIAVDASKRIVRAAADAAADDLWDRQRELAEPALRSADAQEGARAFAERRKPTWRGV